MSGEPSAVVHAGSVTIVLTSGAADAGPHMPLASGSALRTALRTHAGSGGGLGEVKRFWETLNRQCMGVTPDRLIDAVAEAAARGRINAWVFNDPPHVTSADPDKIRADAERRAMERRRAGAQARPAPGAPAPRPLDKPEAIAEMPMDERFFEVMERALPRIGDKAGEQSRAQFEAIVKDPAVLASIVATFVILLALHAVAVGAAIDGVVLAAILASAAIRGHGLLQAARSAILGVKHMVLLIAGVASAKEEKDLDRAADEVAAVIAAIGIELLMATVGKLKGSIKQSAKKTNTIPATSIEDNSNFDRLHIKKSNITNTKTAEKPVSKTDPLPSVRKQVETPYGPALQSSEPAAQAARTRVENGATLYRMGTIGKSEAAEAQFWALEHPSTPGFAERYGIPPENVAKFNFIEAGKLKPGTEFVTRPAPAVGSNPGGGIEVVVPPNGLRVGYFSTGED